MNLMKGLLLCFTHSRSNHCYLTRNQATQPSRRWLNRFLFDWNEVDHVKTDADQNKDTSNLPQFSSPPTVTLQADDYRTIHAAKILGLHNNDTIRAGIVSTEQSNGLLTDTATIEWIPQGKVKKDEPLAKSGNPPGLLRIYLSDLKNASSSASSQYADRISLILAVPRPLQLNRLVPMISQMGVRDLVFTGAHKVPRDYFGSHLFRKPQVLRGKLVEGLCQAGDVQLPQLKVVKELRHLTENHKDDLHDKNLLDRMFPLDVYARVIAHPLREQKGGTLDHHAPPIRMDQVQFPQPCHRKMVLAVGPEGGWREPDELDWFMERGFQHVTLGPRVLRSDCAVVSLVALAHLVCSDPSNDQPVG